MSLARTRPPQRRGEFRARHADLQPDRLRALIQPVEMLIEEDEDVVVQA